MTVEVTQEERDIVGDLIGAGENPNNADAIYSGEGDQDYAWAFKKLRAYRSAAENAVREKIAAWYAREGYVLDEDDVPAAIRAGSTGDKG